MSTDPPTRRLQRRTQQQRSAATQERLLDATIAAIVELGYAGTSTTEVCRRAGVSRGAQVHHFPTKAQLVAAAIDQLFARRHDEFRRSLERHRGDLETALAELWKVYSGPTLEAWMELLIAARTEPELRRQLRRVDQRFFADAQQTCRRLLGLEQADDADVAALTRVILSVLDGLALNRMLGHRERSYRDSLAVVRQLLHTFAAARS